MSVLDVGRRCETCSVVDFLPFTCSICTRVFCRDHVHTHGCSEQAASGPSRKRLRGTCARVGCTSETIESIGGLELGLEEPSEDIARQVRCRACGEAFCIAHRSQEAHDCPAPRELTARHDAGMARRSHAQEVLAKTMPDQAGKARLTMPKQVDRTRVAPESGRLPPSVIAEREAEARAREKQEREEKVDKTERISADDSAAHSSSSAAHSSSSAAASSSSDPFTPSPANSWPNTPAYQKLHKMHCMKIRSLSKPLNPQASRDQSRAVEWTVAEKDRISSWLATTPTRPDGVAAALSDRKPERIWVPDSMPGGKLFDTLVAMAKLPRETTLLRIATSPGGGRTPIPIDIALPVGQQLDTGDVLVLVK